MQLHYSKNRQVQLTGKECTRDRHAHTDIRSRHRKKLCAPVPAPPPALAACCGPGCPAPSGPPSSPAAACMRRTPAAPSLCISAATMDACTPASRCGPKVPAGNSVPCRRSASPADTLHCGWNAFQSQRRPTQALQTELYVPVEGSASAGTRSSSMLMRHWQSSCRSCIPACRTASRGTRGRRACASASPSTSLSYGLAGTPAAL